MNSGGPTRMRPPLVKRPTTPVSGFFRFFSRLWVPGVVSRRCRVLTCLLCTGATERGGTTPVLRCARRRGDERKPRECAAPETFLGSRLPSWSKVGRNASTWASERPARVRSRPRRPWATRAACNRSESGGPINGTGRRGGGPRGGLACTDARPAAGSSAAVRGFPVVSREAAGAAAPLPEGGKNVSLSQAPFVCAYKRRPGPTAGPRGARRSPGPVVSLGGRGISGLPDGCGGTRRRLQTRPR